MSNDSRSYLGKIILAGIGAMAATGEKSKEILDELVKKGELTVEQGKILNEELKRTIKANMSADTDEPGEKSTETDMLADLEKLSPAQRAALKQRLAEMEAVADVAQQ